MRLIDADAMMERLKSWDTNDAIDKALYNFALNRVLEAPTVEPERKTGKWLRTNKHDINGNTGWKCSCCGNITACNGVYCHACGAKMNEGSVSGDGRKRRNKTLLSSLI